MIKITNNNNIITVDLKLNYNKKVQQQLELLAIKYHPNQLFSLDNNYNITNLIFEFENKNDMFLFTLIGNFLDNQVKLIKSDENTFIFENVN